MAKSSLFTEEPATDPRYNSIRSAENDRLKEAKEHCEKLWKDFAPYADRNFLVEVRSNFNSHYWEMYLCAYFMELGFEIDAPKPGPDIGIVYDGCRIWFEAVSPTRGADGQPDQVPEVCYGAVQSVPDDKIILRYLNSISEKYQRQYAQWIRNETISNKDAFVIALNPRGIGFDKWDSDPPRILQAAFTVGMACAILHPDTLEVIRTGYSFRNKIPKALCNVPTGVFQQKDSAALSGLLCSRVDALDRPALTGGDFQLVANPHAAVSLPEAFRLNGTYFRVREREDGYDVMAETSTGERGAVKT